MSKRVAIYARVSTTRQAENDISIPDQLAQAQKYCAARRWFAAGEFIDAGASARDDKRPQFQAMMDHACVDPSPFDVILVHSMSRFFRDLAGYSFWKRRLQKHGVALVSITQSFGEGSSANFAENVLAAADQYHSEETAKHVTRTMLENARQGFWNGSKAPFGYRTIAVEQRGQRTKKHLQIETAETETVRLIFRLFRDGEGQSGPLGVKEIASWLNSHDFKFRDNLFYTSAVHAILTRETYTGTHYFNRHDSRTRRERPREEWVAQSVPAIISEQDFRDVQERLHERRPTVTPARVTNSDVLLTGLARCESCGSRLMVRTGKGGRYRYYACASHRMKGKAACADPIAVPEAQLDDLILRALARHLITPERLPALLSEARKRQIAATHESHQRRVGLKNRIRETQTQIERMYQAVMDGTVTDTGLFRATLTSLEGQRGQCLDLLNRLGHEPPQFRQALSKQQAASIAAMLQRRLLDAAKPLKRRYIRGLVSEIMVSRDKAVISGPRDAIAAAVTSGEFTGEVRTSVREWRTRQDSNL